MPNADTSSEYMPLDALRRAKEPRPWRRNLETLAVIGALFLGGFGMGFVFSSREGDAETARSRGDHLDEIERLQTAHQFAIAALTRSATRAADSAAVAGDQAGAAAEAVTDMAKHLVPRRGAK